MLADASLCVNSPCVRVLLLDVGLEVRASRVTTRVWELFKSRRRFITDQSLFAQR